MRKILIATIALSFATPANAESVVLDLDRMSVITEAAKTICREVMDQPGPAEPILTRESAYLRLNQDERLYLVNMCILYAKGRVDKW